MKKILNFALLYFAISICSAQEHKEKGLQKLSAGAMQTTLASHTFDKTKILNVDYTFAPCLNMIRAKTHYHVMYDVKYNALSTIDGIFLKKDWDAYAFFSQNLSYNESFFALGIEKVKEVSENLEIIFFTDLGINSKKDCTFEFGIILHPQLVFWRSKE